MKKQILVLVVATLSISSVTHAQGGFQRRTPEERLQVVHHKIDSAFKLDAAKMALIDSAFLTAYKAQDAKREELMAGGGQPDRDAMRAEIQKITEARDVKLKAIFSEEQMKIWKEQIEPSMRPQRGQGGNRPQQ